MYFGGSFKDYPEMNMLMCCPLLYSAAVEAIGKRESDNDRHSQWIVYKAVAKVGVDQYTRTHRRTQTVRRVTTVIALFQLKVELKRQ